MPKDRAPQDAPREGSASELAVILSRYPVQDIFYAIRELGFRAPMPASCVCTWPADPTLEEIVLTYSKVTEKLKAKATVKGTVQPDGDRGEGTISCWLEIDLHRADGANWKEILDDGGATGAPKTDTYRCTRNSPDNPKDFEFTREVETTLNAADIAGHVVKLLVEVYWKVEACGDPKGGDRVFKRVSITLAGPPGVPPTFTPTVNDANWGFVALAP